MNEKKLSDVLILARGGGSLEDLWPFNEEVVARAIYESKIPVVSAIGHETDFTIADFVSDLRAPTPSAAAEIVVPDVFELKQKLETYNNKYKILLKRKTELMRLKYEKIMESKVYTDPLKKINEYYLVIDKNIKAIQNRIKIKKNDCDAKAAKIFATLDALSPLKTLSRGYSITELNNKIIKSVNDIKSGDKVNLVFVDGKKNATIT